MLQELFVNACILITFIFIASQIFLNTGLGQGSKVKVRIFLGILAGISSCFLIFYSIEIAENVTLDFRDFCIMLSAIFGGVLSAMITGLITAVFRLLYHGVSDISVISALVILVVSLGTGLLYKIKKGNILKNRLLLLFCLLVRSIIYLLLLDKTEDIVYGILASWISYIIIGIGVTYLVTYLVEAHEMINILKKESYHDYLTGLYNTRLFERKFNVLQKDAIHDNKSLALLIIDIDHFKYVNDTYGHSAGDEVLRKLGEILKLMGRNYNVVARIGGEEFAILGIDLTKEQGKELGDKIRSTIESEIFPIPANKNLKITVSIGIGVFPETVTDVEKLREYADKKLYEAKTTGRNRVCI